MVEARAKQSPAIKPPLIERLQAWWQGYEAVSGVSEPSDEIEEVAEKVMPGSDSIVELEGARDWSPERVQAIQRIFGAGFSQPGGEAYIQRLLAPLGLNETKSVADYGSKLGAVARICTSTTGAWVNGFEPHPVLADEAVRLSTAAGLAKRAVIESTPIEKTTLRDKSCDVVLSCEALHATADKDLVLAKIRRLLKRHGQILITDFVRTTQAESSPDIEIWSAYEINQPVLDTVEDLTGRLEKLGIDVRVSEDMSAIYCQEIAMSLREFSSTMNSDPVPEDLKPWVLWEVDYWARRAEILQGGDIAIYRIHGISK